MISDIEWHVLREFVVARINAPATVECTRAALRDVLAYMDRLTASG